MFGSERLLGGITRPQIAATHASLFGYPCNNHPASALMTPRYGLPEDPLPMLLAAGGGNVFFRRRQYLVIDSLIHSCIKAL
ncbi:unnamed protein product [Cylicostephanus goldi]|uniref:Uncharacterized protein n=1 Tax=Cylicostephanus goldi TaxID=71465 RepID=A0A3P7QHL5_CYLGO|nr:unnamed protein product [Cylicostephanus goldi]